jgi:cytohesin
MGVAGRAWLMAAAVFLSSALAGPLAAQGLFDGNPMFDYARNRDVGAVEYFLKKGANIDEATFDGETVLTIAAGNGDFELVEVALAHGARISHEDKYGKTALSYAAERGHAPVIEKLLEAGADINHQTQDGLTPVMLAVRFDRLSALRVLLKHKPDLTLLDYTGRSALGWARQSRDRRTESMLKRAGAAD